MTTLRRAAELNTGNYDFLGLSPVIKALVEAAKAAHELTIWLDMTREEIASLKEGDDELDDQPLMDHARDMYDAWELWQRLEARVAPILARELDGQIAPDGDDDIPFEALPVGTPEEQDSARAFGQAKAAGWSDDEANAYADFVVRDKLKP